MVGKKTPYDIATCSTLPVIAGRSKWQTPNELLDQAIKASKGHQPEWVEQTVTQRMGDVLEPELIREAGRMLGLKETKEEIEEPIKHPDLPLMGSLDGLGYAENLTFNKQSHNWLVIPEQDEITLDGWGVIECKCTRDFGTNDIEEERGVLQAKGLMECGNYSWAAVIVLWQSTDFRIYLYERNSMFKTHLAQMVLDFDRRVKEEDYYPPISSKDANVIYPRGVPRRDFRLEEGFSKCVERILEAKEEIKRLEGDIDKQETMLKEAMGTNEYANLNKFIIKWPTIMYKATKERVVPAKPARVIRQSKLSIKEIKNDDRT